MKVNEVDENEMVTIPLSKYLRLIECQKTLYALNAAGVDNWEGYDFAMDILKEEEL